MTTILVGLGMFIAGVGATRVFDMLRKRGGRHRLRKQPRHRGWEGRESDLERFKAAFLIARERAGLRWPPRDLDQTVEFEAVSTNA